MGIEKNKLDATGPGHLLLLKSHLQEQGNRVVKNLLKFQVVQKKIYLPTTLREAKSNYRWPALPPRVSVHQHHTAQRPVEKAGRLEEPIGVTKSPLATLQLLSYS